MNINNDDNGVDISDSNIKGKTRIASLFHPSNNKLQAEDDRNKNLPRLPIYYLENGIFKKLKNDDNECFIYLAPQSDVEWVRNLGNYFTPDGNNLYSQYYDYQNPLYKFFVSGYLSNIENFRAENIFKAKIIDKTDVQNDIQAWKGADIYKYDDTQIGQSDYIGTQQKNYRTNGFMQSIALYKPYLCNDQHLETIISAALKFYDNGWRYDNSELSLAKSCKEPTNDDNRNQYINLKYVVYLLFFAVEVRRLPDTQDGALKGYNEIEKVKLPDSTLHLVEKAVKKKVTEVLKNEGNTNKLNMKQIGNKFRLIKKLEEEIKTKQNEYRDRLYKIIKYGLYHYGEFEKEPIRYNGFKRIFDKEKYLKSIQDCESEKLIKECEEINLRKSRFSVVYLNKYHSIQGLLTEKQKQELCNISAEIEKAKKEKEVLHTEIGTEDFHNQIKELDEMRKYLTFFREHSKCNLSLLVSIINWLCSLFGSKPLNDDRKFNVEKNPFDLINGATSEPKPNMEPPDNMQSNINVLY